MEFVCLSGSQCSACISVPASMLYHVYEGFRIVYVLLSIRSVHDHRVYALRLLSVRKHIHQPYWEPLRFENVNDTGAM